MEIDALNHANRVEAIISVTQLNSAKKPMKKTIPPVCVVDDDADVREVVENLLQSKGFEVETLASARRFMARTGMEPPACLIMDVNLPGLAGWSCNRS
jgi:FixJ family two-component response regulator